MKLADGQRSGHFERRRTAQAGAGWDGAVDGRVESGEMDSAPGQLVQDALDVVRPRGGGVSCDVER